jgi:hypothetical protein
MRSSTANFVALDEKAGRSFRHCKDSTWGQELQPNVFYAFNLLQLDGKDLRNLLIEKGETE